MIHLTWAAIWLNFGYTCISCHDGLGSYQDFEHSARFALEGGHADLTCETCHAELVQRITGEACGACHEEPDLHVGQFGQQCDRCHVITAWAPAQLQSIRLPAPTQRRCVDPM